MKLYIVDFNNVQLDLDTGVPTNFNTNFHTADEAPDLPIPTNKPYSFGRWLPLILSTRGLDAAVVQTVRLTRAQVRIVVEAAGASVHTRVMNRVYVEDLEEDVHPAFGSLSFPNEGLFMRLGACSPKDGAHLVPGQLSLHSIDDIILRLTTSGRASGTFSNMLNSDAQDIRIFFLPFDARMKTQREYRVFCVPGSLRISAVSQYQWHKPWMFAAKSAEERDAIAKRIMAGIEQLHARIMGDLRGTEDDRLLAQQGFTFDVLYDEKRECCELIELNTFGVRSACGSCLFQWVKDRDLLYGWDAEEIEFRVTV
ncbi:hypothetical protein B0J13DRAFT_676563 [Dactylonectria estremocensis]|uniref:Cell division cycle protein 123 n=1 Tax=Dactylonectria estremocensis TaxID=1079267 RepID=A0A9P9EN60_9HYPO|nr:hypothetical protein B0J13DRAFT_676563 [Dactylonectria estremocensis]